MIALQGACTQTMHPHTDTQCNTPGTHTQYTQTTLLHSTHSDNIPIARSAAHAHRQLVGFQCDVWTTRSRAVWPRRVKPTVQQFLNSRFLTLSETAPFGLSCSLIGQTRPMGEVRLFVHSLSCQWLKQVYVSSSILHEKNCSTYLQHLKHHSSCFEIF